MYVCMDRNRTFCINIVFMLFVSFSFLFFFLNGYVVLFLYVLVLLQTLTCLFFIILILSKYDNIAMWWLFADTEVA